MADIAGLKAPPRSRWTERARPFWKRRELVAVGIMLTLPLPLHAHDLPRPSGPVLLVVKGLIARTNVDDEAHLDRNLLKEFGVKSLTTWTPWTDGEIVFVGVPLRNLLDGLDSAGDLIRARALNDYFVEIPTSDAYRYDVLLAWNADGVDFTRRDKGPLWIIYPWSQNEDLNNRVTSGKSIWQLHEIYIDHE